MLLFYRKASALGVACLVFSAVVLYFCFVCSERTLSLLPREQSDIVWQPKVFTDEERGGVSTYQLHDATDTIDYEFLLKKAFKYPYVVFALRFAQNNENTQTVLDLADFSSAVIRLKCSPSNILAFTTYVADHDSGTSHNMNSARIASAYFPCDKRPSSVTFDLQHLEVPDWWLAANGKSLSNKKYYLHKTFAMALWNSAQSPTETPSHVVVDSWVLTGRVWWYVYLGAGGLVLLWSWVIVWCIRQHALALTAHIKTRLQRELPLVAYQQLCIEPHKDKEKSALLLFVATEYANPDLGLETAMASLGINRNKINEMLKAETGLTFTAYLNKVRLTEAARLLAENKEFGISEAAYSVGYNNVSYFNKLFKAEYGCTPKTFQSAAAAKPD